MKDPEQKNDLSQEEKIVLLIDQKADLSDDLSQVVIEKPELLDTIFNGVSSKTPRIKFRCAKILKIISAKKPELLIPHWDFFINLLKSDNKIILWNALDILANLTSKDQDHKFDEIYNLYYEFLEDDSMVTATHVIENSSIIASNRTDLQEDITLKLLNINAIPRDGECNAILSGKAIQAFENYFDASENKEEILNFAREQIKSSRNATKLKAQNFIEKHGS
jgi:hypothetical protein